MSLENYGNERPRMIKMSREKPGREIPRLV